MNCRRAQTDIALWAGNDLDETDRLCLQRHLEACPDCRDYQAQMRALMQLVDDCPLKDQADETSKSAVSDSLWPSLSSQLVSLPSTKSDHFNGWIPAVAVAAVCLAMLMVASPQSAFPPDTSGGTTNVTETSWTGTSETSPLAIGHISDRREDGDMPRIEPDLFSGRAEAEGLRSMPPDFPFEGERFVSPEVRDVPLDEVPEDRRFLGPSVIWIFKR